MDWKRFLKPSPGKIAFSMLMSFFSFVFLSTFRRQYEQVFCMESIKRCPFYNSWILTHIPTCECHPLGTIIMQWTIYIIIPFIFWYVIYSTAEYYLLKNKTKNE